MLHKYFECGKIINTHGVRGAVKVEAYCDSPKVLAELPKIYFKENGDDYREVKVLHGSLFGRFVLLALEGVADLETAVALKNRYIYAHRDDLHLPEGSCFVGDLIGLPVLDADTGKKYGVLRDVANAGASDIYIIDTLNGERMIPAVPEFIIRALPEDAVYIRPIDGMFD